MKKEIDIFLNELIQISENKNQLYSTLIPIILSKKFMFSLSISMHDF